MMLLRAAEKGEVKEWVSSGRKECHHSRELLEGHIEMPVFLQRPEGMYHKHTRVSKANSLVEGLK